MLTTTLRYELEEDWEQLPAGYRHPDVPAVGVDSRDRVYLLCRGENLDGLKHHPVMVYDRRGAFIASWGEGLLSPRPHGITIGPDDMAYVTDEPNHVVHKLTLDGRLVMTIGTHGVASEDGAPFNRPCNVAVTGSGDIYVADGYGADRVHHFSPTGKLVRSWGSSGSGPGEFHTPHGIWAHPDGRVFVADRANNRLQIFSPEGEYLDQWPDVQRPQQLFIGGDGLVYVGESELRPTKPEFAKLTLGLGHTRGLHAFKDGKELEITEETRSPSRVSVYDGTGKVLARWGGPEPSAPGSFTSPHGISADSRGAVYVGETTWSFSGIHGLVGADCHTIQKFVRAEGPLS
jgi:hypothetical protein